MFLLGGLSGLFLGSVPIDVYASDTYFIVAHFHYTMMGGTVMGLLAGLHFWFPKMSGKMYNETVSKFAFAALGRAIAIDMESATIAAQGFRFRVPYGTLLCVSDKPLHGEIKLPGMANTFYRERVDQHLRIGLRALELLRSQRKDQIHSRKLRSFAEVAFQ